MSNFTGAASIASYVSGVTAPLTGQRLSKVLFKLDKTTGVKPENKAVSIPVVNGAEVQRNLTRLMPHVIAYLETVQDSLVRERVVAGAAFISDDDISMEAVIGYLESDAKGDRLTKESIGAWFSASVECELAALFAAKLGISETPTDAESDKVMAAVAGYASKYQMLAGGKTSFEPSVAKKLVEVLDTVCGAEDALAGKFKVRLNKMIAAPSTLELLGL